MPDETNAGDCTMDCVMGHTNEPGCLYDTTPKPHETSAGETGRRDAMPDERLAEIQADHATYLRDVERFGLGGLVRGARIRMEAIGDLLAEVLRLRAELDAVSTHTAEQIRTWNEVDRLTTEQLRERIVADTEYGLLADGFEPDRTRAVGTGKTGRREAYATQQLYHRVMRRPAGHWREDVGEWTAADDA